MHVDAVVSDVEGIDEEVVAMGDRSGEQRDHQEEPLENDPGSTCLCCQRLGVLFIIIVFSLTQSVCSYRLSDWHRFILIDVHFSSLRRATRSLRTPQPADGRMGQLQRHDDLEAVSSLRALRPAGERRYGWCPPHG